MCGHLTFSLGSPASRQIIRGATPKFTLMYHYRLHPPTMKSQGRAQDSRLGPSSPDGPQTELSRVRQGLQLPDFADCSRPTQVRDVLGRSRNCGGRTRTCNPRINSAVRYHCATPQLGDRRTLFFAGLPAPLRLYPAFSHQSGRYPPCDMMHLSLFDVPTHLDFE